jgi:hypothetical protein
MLHKCKRIIENYSVGLIPCPGWDGMGLHVEAVILVHTKAGLDGIARHNGWLRMGWD